MAPPLVTRGTGDIIPAADHNDVKSYIEDGTYRVKTKYLQLPSATLPTAFTFGAGFASAFYLSTALGSEAGTYALCYAGQTTATGSVMLAGTSPNAGVYRSVDSGATWTYIKQLGSQVQNRCMIPVGSAGIVLAGTYNPTTSATDIYKSTDYGLTWDNGYALSGETTVICLIDLGGGIVLAGTGTGYVWKSTDSGTSWSQIARLGSSTGVYCFTDLGGGTVLAGTDVSGKVFKSTNYGASWDSGIQLGTTTYVQCILTTGSGVVYAGASTGSVGKVYKSINSGTSWDSGTAVGSEIYIMSLANCVDSAGTSVLLAGTYSSGQVYKSTDAGGSWTLVQRCGTETFVYWLVYAPSGVVVAGTNGKIFNSTNYGITGNGLISYDSVSSQMNFTNNGGSNWDVVSNNVIVAGPAKIDSGVANNNLVAYQGSKWIKAVMLTPIGICTNIITGKVQTSGVVSGLTGLSAGNFYWSDDNGNLTLTPTANLVKVGFAISATELALDIDTNKYFQYSPYVYSYFGGGTPTGSYQITNVIDYLTSGSTSGTASASGALLNDQGANPRGGSCIGVTGITYGYFVGGTRSSSNPSPYANNVDYITISTGVQTTGAAVNTLTVGRTGIQAVGGYNNTYAFLCGGQIPGPLAYIDLINVTLGANANNNVASGSSLSPARTSGCGITGYNYGFVCGGVNTGTYYKHIDSINLTTSSGTVGSRGDLATTSAFAGGLSASNYSNYGFYLGGLDAGVTPSAVIQWINVLLGIQNASNRGNLTNAAYGTTSTSTRGNKGYFKQGYTTTYTNVILYLDMTTNSGGAISWGTGSVTITGGGGV